MRSYKRGGDQVTPLFCLLGILLGVGVLIFMALDCPLKVSVKNESITIHQMKNNLIIPIETIEEIRLCDNSDTQNSRRTFGSGGAFGYLGKFSNLQLGDYKMYVTDVSKEILVNTNGNIIIFSCNQPEKLVQLVNTMR
jgi:hypothetical protein